MINLLIPLGIAATKLIVKYSVTKAISDGIFQAKYEVDKKISRKIFSVIFNLVINILLLTASVYLLPLFFDKDVVVYAVSSVYLGSMIYAIFTIIAELPLFYIFIFDHKLSLTSYVEREIYNEVHKKAHSQLNGKNFLIRGLNSFFGESPSSIANSVAKKTTRIVIKPLTLIVVRMIIVIFAYIMIFRLLIAPVLIKDATDLNIYQAATYPLFYAIDYFFETKFLTWII